MNPSTRNLLLSNGATLAAALAFDWEAGWLLWPYWVQSVVIGWYARQRMLALRQFSTEGFTSNGRRVPEDESGKRSTASFFALHYGFFHAGYLFFLWQEHRPHAGWDWLVLLGCGASFVLSQRESFAAQHAADLRGRPNLGTLMFTPYLRVLPMHLAVIAGSAVGGGAGMLVFFTVLKTVSDVGMDVIDRRMAARSADRFATSQAS